jgi:hypothetical protein
MNSMDKLRVAGLVAAVGMAPMTALAESSSDTGPSGLSAAARLNLSVTIPAFLYFQVGSVGVGNVDQITFSPTDSNVGSGTPIAGVGGDAASGSGANVVLRSNSGQITITATNDGGVNGLGSAGDISLTEIATTSDDSALAAPTLTDGGTDTASPTLNSGDVTDRSAVWTYSYQNTTTPASGTYSAEITYTAASL